MNSHFKKVDRRFDDKFNKCGWADAKCTHFYLGNDHDSANSNDIKDFIHSQINLSLEEMIKEVVEKLEKSRIMTNTDKRFSRTITQNEISVCNKVLDSLLTDIRGK
jgi:hypothetical protein